MKSRHEKNVSNTADVFSFYQNISTSPVPSISLVWDRILRQEAATAFKILLTQYKLVVFPSSSTVLLESLLYMYIVNLIIDGYIQFPLV